MASHVQSFIYISLCDSKSHLKMENTSILFENNFIASGRIIRLDSGRCNFTSSNLTFRNNTRNTSAADDPQKSTVFMLKESEMFEIIQSELSFINNSAQYLSGGITLIKKSTIYCDQRELNFYGNKGGDG